MDNSHLELIQTPYGYIQYSAYRNPELFHEQVGHFASNLAVVFGVNDDHDHDDAPTRHHHSSGCCHDDEFTPIDELYPRFDPNSSTFGLPYENYPTHPLASDVTPVDEQHENHAHCGATGENAKEHVTTIDTEPSTDDETLLYIGTDANIYHIKGVVMGDQNAGKSTFLHSLTAASDPSFLLLNRYLPILQSTFYNARVIQHGMIYRDEIPFLDSDLGVLQLFLTTDEFAYLIHDAYNSITEDLPHYEEFIRHLEGYSHVCIELVELGGDHLDRLFYQSYTNSFNQMCHNDENSKTKMTSFEQMLIIYEALLRNKYGTTNLSDRLLAPPPAPPTRENAPHTTTCNPTQEGKDAVADLLHRTHKLLQVRYGGVQPRTPFGARLEGGQGKKTPFALKTGQNWNYFVNLLSLFQWPESKQHQQLLPRINPHEFLLLFLRTAMIPTYAQPSTVHVQPSEGQSSSSSASQAPQEEDGELSHADLLQFDLVLLRAPLKCYPPLKPKTKNYRFASKINQYLLAQEDKTVCSPSTETSDDMTEHEPSPQPKSMHYIIDSIPDTLSIPRDQWNEYIAFGQLHSTTGEDHYAGFPSMLSSFAVTLENTLLTQNESKDQEQGTSNNTVENHTPTATAEWSTWARSYQTLFYNDQHLLCSELQTPPHPVLVVDLIQTMSDIKLSLDGYIENVKGHMTNDVAIPQIQQVGALLSHLIQAESSPIAEPSSLSTLAQLGAHTKSILKACSMEVPPGNDGNTPSTRLIHADLFLSILLTSMLAVCRLGGIGAQKNGGTHTMPAILYNARYATHSYLTHAEQQMKNHYDQQQLAHQQDGSKADMNHTEEKVQELIPAIEPGGLLQSLLMMMINHLRDY